MLDGPTRMLQNLHPVQNLHPRAELVQKSYPLPHFALDSNAACARAVGCIIFLTRVPHENARMSTCNNANIEHIPISD